MNCGNVAGMGHPMPTYQGTDAEAGEEYLRIPPSRTGSHAATLDSYSKTTIHPSSAVRSSPALDHHLRDAFGAVRVWCSLSSFASRLPSGSGMASYLPSPPSAAPCVSESDMCADAKLSSDATAIVLAAVAASEAPLLPQWTQLVADERAAALRAFQRLGLALKDRQALANALSRAIREGRLPAPAPPLPPLPPLETLRRDAAALLRASPPVLIAAFGAGRHAEMAALADADLLSALPEGRRLGLLEMVGLRTAHAKVVLGSVGPQLDALCAEARLSHSTSQLVLAAGRLAPARAALMERWVRMDMHGHARMYVR